MIKSSSQLPPFRPVVTIIYVLSRFRTSLDGLKLDVVPELLVSPLRRISWLFTSSWICSRGSGRLP
jgi:hypothetical protein